MRRAIRSAAILARLAAEATPHFRRPHPPHRKSSSPRHISEILATQASACVHFAAHTLSADEPILAVSCALAIFPPAQNLELTNCMYYKRVIESIIVPVFLLLVTIARGMERVHAKPDAVRLRFGVAVRFVGPVESVFMGKFEHVAPRPEN